MQPRLPARPRLRRAWIHRPRIDRDLARYLVRGEDVVVQVRRHPLSLLRPALAAIAVTLATFWVDLNAPAGDGGRGLTNVAWAVWFATIGWLVWRVLNWRRDFFVATDKRFLLFYGFVIRRVAMMPLVKVTDMTFNRTLMGRLWGYGSFVLESAGRDQALSQIDYVPHANANYHAICEVLFGRDGDEEEWDEDGEGEPTDGWDDPTDGWDGDGWDGPPDRPEPDPPGGRGPEATDEWDGTSTPVRPRRRRPAPAGAPGGSPTGSRTRAPRRPRAESVYRSPDLVRADRDADTGEIPVIRPIRRF